MKATLISKENNVAKFTMEFTAEEFEEAIVKAYQATKGQFEIDGFRKGKAPRSIIEKKYGEGVFFEDAINYLFQSNYPVAVNELDLEVIDSPKVDFSEIAKGKGFTVTIEVAVYPVIEVKDYKGVEVDQIIPEVSDEVVDGEIEALRKRNARIENADRPVQEGDTVILDYSGFVGDNQFEGGTAERQELKIGSGMFIPGFEEQLVGVKSGEEKDVKVTFPEEYHADDLAGAEAVFHCLVHEIKEEILPELDDEFAKDVSEFDTLEELKKDTAEKLLKSAELQAEAAAKDAIIEKVYQANETEAPASLVEDEINRMAQELDQQLRYQGLSLEQYIQFVGKDPMEFREELREEAAKKVATRIVLMSIVEAEAIEVAEEELEAELQNMADLYKTEVENIKAMIGENMDFFKKDIQLKKVIDMLYDEAKVSKVKPEVKEEKAEDAE